MKTIDEQINEVLRLAGVKPLQEQQLFEGLGGIVKTGAIICLVSLATFIASQKLNKQINVDNPSQTEISAVKRVYDILIANKGQIKFDSVNYPVSTQYKNDAGECKVLADKSYSNGNIDGVETQYGSELLSVDCVMPKYNKHFKMTTSLRIGYNKTDNASWEFGNKTDITYNNDTDSTMDISVEDAIKMADMINSIKIDTGFANSKYGQPTEPSDVQDSTSTNDGSISASTREYSNRSSEF